MSEMESTGATKTASHVARSSNRESAQAASPITYVATDDAPLLMMHGSAERVIPCDQAIRLDAAALKKAGMPATLSPPSVTGAVTWAFSRTPG